MLDCLADIHAFWDDLAARYQLAPRNKVVSRFHAFNQLADVLNRN